VALTGRTAALALAGVLVVLGIRSVTGLVIVEGLLAAGIALDLLLAAPVRALGLSRAGDTKVRLGETASVTLMVVNPAGRPLRAVLRDAWPPSAGAAPRFARVLIPAGGSAPLRTSLTPSRRGDATAATVAVRSFGPLGLAARQGRHAVPWTVRALPPFRSRRHLPEKLSRLRELDGQHRSLLRGQGSEFDSLREYVVGDDVRSSTGAAPPGTRTCWCGPGAPSGTAGSSCCSIPGGPWPGGWGTRPGWTSPWTRCSC
jgi:uncharacterized protein (DUF58 family)